MDPSWKPAAGSGAALIHELSVTLYVGCALIFLFVMALVLYAVFRPARAVRERRWLIGGGLVFPGIVLGALLVYSIAVGGALNSFQGQGTLRFLLDCVSDASRALGRVLPGNDALRIEVNARQWWWEVTYAGAGGEFELANEIHLPAGRAVELDLVTADVIHSFWVPRLGGKMDAVPGKANRMVLHADAPGRYRGVCAEYCGIGHAPMQMVVIAHPAEAYAAALAEEAGSFEAPPQVLHPRPAPAATIIEQWRGYLLDLAGIE